MGQMKTPGVYIHEKNAFPNSVVEVATAVPAFIGYTEKAEYGGKSLVNKPWRVTSLAEYEHHFGGAPNPIFDINKQKTEATKATKATEVTEDGGDTKDSKESPAKANEKPEEAAFSFQKEEYDLKITSGNYLFYYNMKLFFQNGGGACYVVSVGDYTMDLDLDKLKDGINRLVKEQEPTMLVIPELVLMKEAECTDAQQAMIAHCGEKMRSRIAILDIYEGYKDLSEGVIDKFRNALGINFLDFATAYYPWVNTTIVGDSAITYESIGNKVVLQTLLKAEMGIDDPLPADAALNTQQLNELIEKVTETGLKPDEKVSLNKTLLQISPLFNLILKEIKDKLNLLPTSAVMAGIYSMVDNSRGVWKAPANVSLNSVVTPSVNISHDDQEDLNITLQGKSINAIRAFVGEGTLVWGARTLDGNSQDWRYINVRRTMIMLEQSIKIASKAYVFEPNVANTWVAMKSMITNFLTNIWKRGGLAGATPTDAFSVHIGLGETMTSNDILDGIMRITVLVAISRPAEFIEITFQQQVQKS